MENQAELLSAFYEFQQKVQNPGKDTEGYGYKYATLDSVIKSVKEAMEGTGLSFNQEVTSNEDKIGVTTNIFHKSGQMMSFGPFFIDKVNAKQMNNAQGAGAAITYARRYSLSATAGIASEEDTDASSDRGNNYSSQSTGGSSKSSKRQSKTAKKKPQLPEKAFIRIKELKEITEDSNDEWNDKTKKFVKSLIKNYNKDKIDKLTDEEFTDLKEAFKGSLDIEVE